MANFYMKEKVWNKIQNYSKYAYDEYKSEIGGMLLAEKDKEGKWNLHSPVILKQNISAGNTVLSKEALASYYVKTAMRLKDRDIKFVWWHSHHTMEVFWSGTDLIAIDEMNQGDWSISLVVNLKQEYKLRVNVWKPYPAVVDDLPLDIIRNKPDMPKAIINEVEKLCTEPPVTYLSTHKSYKGTQGNLWNNRGNQLSTFNQTNRYSQEDVLYEAKVDDMLTDYGNGSLNYLGFLTKISAYNEQLRSTQSMIRIGVPDSEEQLDTISMILDAEDFLHRSYEKWNPEDKVIEKGEDVEELRAYNESFLGV